MKATGTFEVKLLPLDSYADGQRLILEVVPDSGTGQLATLTGQMSIFIQNGQHNYEFDYSLA